jgi:hypothetical protein
VQYDYTIVANNGFGSSSGVQVSGTPAASGGPVGDLFSASFTAANGTAITAYTPETDPSGTGMAYSAFGSDGAFEIQSNFVAAPALADNNTTIKECQWELDSPVPATYDIYYDFVMQGTSTGVPGMLLAGDTADGHSCYYLRLRDGAEVEIVRLGSGGSFNTLVNTGNEYTFTDGEKYRLRVRVDPTNITVFAQGITTPSAEVQVCTAADSTNRGPYFGWRMVTAMLSRYGAGGEIFDEVKVDSV